jgi:hypothetical protein
MVKATEAVVELDVTEGAIRNDGGLRAGAGPGFQGVKVSFNMPEVGRVQYATDKHEFWQHNIYAIALALENLRAVERYGVNSGKEQYTGFKAIGGATAVSNGKMTPADAARFFSEHVGHGATPEEFWNRDEGTDREFVIAHYRQLAMRFHPDQGGSAELFKKLQEARAVLEGARNG